MSAMDEHTASAIRRLWDAKLAPRSTNIYGAGHVDHERPCSPHYPHTFYPDDRRRNHVGAERTST